MAQDTLRHKGDLRVITQEETSGQGGKAASEFNIVKEKRKGKSVLG